MKNIYFSLLLILAFSISTYSQNVGINTSGSPADNSSMLDVNASDKGILIPRVALSNVVNASTPINAPAIGLLVFNTNASVAGGYGEGFYYWSGSAWTKIATGDALSSTLTNGRIWVGDGTGIPVERLVGGDGTISNTGVLDLSDNAVETSEINNLAVTTAKIADGNVTTVKIASDAVDNTKLANMPSNTIKANNTGAGADPSDVPIGLNTVLGRQGGNIVAAQVGTTQIGDNVVDNTKLSDMAVNTLKGRISAGTGDPQDLSAAQVKAILGLDNGVNGTGTQNYLTKWNNAGGTNIGDSQIRDNGSTVGIGMAPSTSKLSVDGSVYIPTGSSYWIGSHTDAGDRLRMHLSGANAFIDYASGSLTFRSGTTFRMILQANGDLGIGTTPLHRLDVSNTAGPQIVARGAGQTADQAIGFITGAATDWVGKIGHLGSLTGVWSLDMWTDENAPITFWNNSTEKMRILGNGNVAIGNTVGSHKLHVTGDIWAEGKYVVQNSMDGGANRGIFMWNSGDSNWGIYMGQSGAGRSLSGGTAVAGGGFTAHAIRFRSSSSATQGFIFENQAEQSLLSIRGNNGRATFRGGVLFECIGCGSNSIDGDGTSNWGNLTIQGRVISTNSNLHLSPPGGSAVYINSDYRAAGGGAGVTNVIVGGSVLPQGNLVAGRNLGAGGSAWYDTYTDAIFRNFEFALSDERMKTNIRPLNTVLSGIMALNVVKYDYNLHKMYNGEWTQRDYIDIDGKNNFGFLAQELQKVYPELVKEHREKGVLMVNLEGLIPILIKGMQEQQAKIEELEKMIQSLKK